MLVRRSLKVFEDVRSWKRKLSPRGTALLLCFVFMLGCAICVRSRRAVLGSTGAGLPTVGSGRMFYCFCSESAVAWR